MAALWPERVKALVSVSGYLIGSQEAGKIRCRRRPSCSGGTSTTSPPNAAARATRRTGATSPSSSGRRHRRSGPSTTPPSSAAPRARQPRPRRHRDPQLPLAPRPGRGRGEVRGLERRLAKAPAITCRRSRSKAMPTARRTRRSGCLRASKFTGRYEHRDSHGRHRPQPAAGSARGLRGACMSIFRRDRWPFCFGPPMCAKLG
jgi:hypothetical protein